MNEFFSEMNEALSFQLFRIGQTPLTLSTLITLLAILVLTYWISGWLRRLTVQLLAKRHPSTANTLAVLIHHAVLVVGFSTALSTAGIDLTGLFTAGAIFAVGLGFAMQSIVQNFVAGVILLTERSIKPGDVLEVEGLVVKVSDMGVRASIAKSRDGEEIIIPNSVLSQNSVKNYTLSDSLYRVGVEVGVSYDSDMKQVKSTLERVAAKVTNEWGTTSKKPLVIMTSFGDSSVDWAIHAWIKDPWDLPSATSDLLQAVWWAFREAGIVIAFPQMDVHVDRPIAQALGTLAAR